ncbi:MAG TPA: aldehyde dehydrogenase family protein [Gemmatimonadales bacterium]|nr:aldehyde dehydrogenase family protein [Gemmatimonadales bacterium]
MSPHGLKDSPSAADPARAAQPPRPTADRLLDSMVARLGEGAPVFAKLSLADRIALARSMQAGYLAIAERSVHAACAAKGLPLGTPAEGEEWTNPWCVVRHLRLITESLHALQRTGNTPIGPVSETVDGRLSIRVFPANGIDGVLFSGISAEVHTNAGVTAETMQRSRASFYKAPWHQGRTVLVLGPGNLTMIPAMDVISKMFNEGKVCLLKMSPVNSYHGPYLEEAFAEPIARGFLAVAYGGAEGGAYLARHPGIDEIHLTGSAQTYDALVWGPPGPEREARKVRNTPVLTKPVTAELGNVSPVLVIPGPYRDKDLAFQAEAIAGAMVHNASFNCNSAKLVLSAKGWTGRARLLSAIERVLAATPTRQAYYPGAEERWQRFTQDRQAVRTIGRAGQGQLPWTLLSGLDPMDSAEPAFSGEPLCAVLSETAVGSDDPIEYLERAVDFANNRVWGTLAATVVVHPKTLKDPRLGQAVEQAISRLRYGSVALNAWTGLSFALGTPPWGGHPSSSPADIQSGSGWVHNTPMLEGIEKTVLRHPVTIMPKPVTFPSHRTAHTLLRRLTVLEQTASWAKVPGVVAAAMRA